MKPTKDTEDEWMNVTIDGKQGSGAAVAVLLERVAEVAEDSPDWARYELELEVTEYDSRKEKQ